MGKNRRFRYHPYALLNYHFTGGGVATLNTYGKFNGSNIYVQETLGAAAVYPYTLAVWTRTTTTSTQAIIQLADSSVPDHYSQIVILSDGRFQLSSRAGGGSQSAISPDTDNDGEWHHVAAVFTSATDRKLYVNGVEKASDTTNTTPLNLGRLSVGRMGDSTPSLHYDGDVAKAQYYGVALTPAQIASLAAAASIVPTPVTNYDFDEGSGLSVGTGTLNGDDPDGANFWEPYTG